MVVVFDIETTGLDPYKSKVILIGLKRGSKIIQWMIWKIKDEAEMIISAIKEILNIDETIVGYNNLKFDVPYMLKRLDILGKNNPEYWKIHYKKWFDLYQYLGNDYRSLSLWIKKAGIKQKYPHLKGRDMPIYYQNKEYDKIIKHNIDDLETCEKLFYFLKKANPELIPFE